jgi:porin
MSPRRATHSGLLHLLLILFALLLAGVQAQNVIVEDWESEQEALKKHGIAFQAGYTGSFMSHLQGGFREGTNWQGLVDLSVLVDLDKFMGWKGAAFHAEVIWVQGRSASSMAYIGNMNEVSNIQGMANTVRPFHVWLQQQLWGDKVRINAGWLTLDTDFMVSNAASLFINSAYGPIQTWNMNFNAPVYPLSSLGFFAEWQVNDQYEVQAGVYDGNFGGEKGNRRSANTRLGTDDGAAILLELARTHHIGRLAGTAKIGGGWNTGFSTVNSTGLLAHGNGHFYAMLDQTLVPGIGKDAADRLTFFTRAGRAIHPGRSMVDLTLEGGFVGRGVRENDQWGVAMTWSRVSNSFVQATLAGGGTTSSSETAIELTYKAQLTPWMALQPTLQRIYNPQSGTPNATVLGMVLMLNF